MIKFLMKHQGRAFGPNRRGFTEGVGSTFGFASAGATNKASS
jgi:hypothetical protein